MRYLYLLPLLFLFSCSDKMNPAKSTFTYLALGDSYTIGEGVLEDERWPVQLVSSLRARDVDIDDPRIVAKTGWTTHDLLEAIDRTELRAEYSMVSLLIGVNNQYQAKEIEEMIEEFTRLLELAIKFAADKPERVFVLSIPDYGVTPFSQQKDPAQIAREIDHYNQLQEKIAANYKVSYYDITPSTRQALQDLTLLADDQLHPSGVLYQRWVEQIADDVAQLLPVSE